MHLCTYTHAHTHLDNVCFLANRPIFGIGIELVCNKSRHWSSFFNTNMMNCTTKLSGKQARAKKYNSWKLKNNPLHYITWDKKTTWIFSLAATNTIRKRPLSRNIKYVVFYSIRCNENENSIWFVLLYCKWITNWLLEMWWIRRRSQVK